MDVRSDFVTAVEGGLGNLPYTVTATKKGFDLVPDEDEVGDGAAAADGPRRPPRFLLRVRLGTDGTYSVTEIATGTRRGPVRVAWWQQRGRLRSCGSETTWRFDGSLRPTKIAHHTYDSDEVRNVVTAAGDRLGLMQHRGPEERLGLIVGFGTLAAVVVMGVVLALL